jgi:hypothetical protein
MNLLLKITLNAYFCLAFSSIFAAVQTPPLRPSSTVPMGCNTPIDELDALADEAESCCTDEESAKKPVKNVIIFNGTSSSGKTMLVDLIKPVLEPQIGLCKKVQMDQFSNQTVKRCEKINASTLKKLGNWGGEHWLTLTKILESKATTILCDVVLLTKDGKDITASFVKELLEDGCNVFVILVYCPLLQLWKNVQRRNSSAVLPASPCSLGIEEEQRNILAVIDQYLNAYVNDQQANRAIARLFGEEIGQCINWLLDLPDLSKDGAEQMRDFLVFRLRSLQLQNGFVPVCPVYESYNYIFYNDGQDLVLAKAAGLRDALLHWISG